MRKKKSASPKPKGHDIPGKEDQPGRIAESLGEAGQFKKKYVFTSPAEDPKEPGKIQKILKSNN